MKYVENKVLSAISNIKTGKREREAGCVAFCDDIYQLLFFPQALNLLPTQYLMTTNNRD